MVDDSSSELTTSNPPPTRTLPTASSLTTYLESPSLQITQHKLNGTNFREWFQSVLLVVIGKGKEGYLTSDVARSSTESAGSSIWEAENAIVMAWLVNSMEPKISRTYLFYKTACEIWKVVQEIYSDLKNSAQCFQVRSLIRTTKQGQTRSLNISIL